MLGIREDFWLPLAEDATKVRVEKGKVKFLSQVQDTTKCLKRSLEEKGEEEKIQTQRLATKDLVSRDQRCQRRTRKFNVVEGVLLSAKREKT